MFKGLGKFVRRRTVNNIIEEINWQRKKSKNRTYKIFFIDEVFGSNAPWIDEFAPRYRKEVGLPFYAEYHPKTLKLRVLDRLVEAGVDEINFGIQTFL